MYYFSLARTALKVGISLYGYENDKVVLIPNFLCDSVTGALFEENINVVTYDLLDNLQPNWNELNGLCIENNVFAVLMVHYFGQPQLIGKFQDLCNKYNILLIEDNAHGYGGRFNGKKLGTYGDIGIASPRKFLNSSYGGELYLKENSFKMNNTSINILPSLNFSLFDELKKIIFYFPKLSLFLKSIKYSSINFSDPYYFQEGVKEDRYLCESSINLINRVDWGAISCQRRGLWVEWEEFAKSHGLSPVFKEVWPESTPWSFPVFTKNVEQRNEWIKWGVKYKVLLFSWPALPTLEIEKKSSAFKKWERVLCFPLDGLSPEDLCDAAKNTTI
jgi:perosamine synthetase